MTKAKATYQVVTSADGIVFAVFAESMKAEAAQKAKMMSRPGQTFYADTVTTSKRPIIGGRL